MSRKFMYLFLAATFAMYPVAFPVKAMAAAKALSDAEMDQIAAGTQQDDQAGDWVLAALNQKSHKKNKLDIDSESQSNIKAVSNANTVDSAVAVQTNISNATEGAVDMNQSNTAAVTNVATKDTVSFSETKHKSQ